MADEGTTPEAWENVAWGAFAVLCGFEAFLLWHQLKDTPPGLLARSKIQGFLARVASPCDKCRQYRTDKARMHWHAYLHTQGKYEDDEGMIHELVGDDSSTE